MDEGHRPSAQENTDQFEQRKQEHIKLSLTSEMQTRDLLGLDQIQLIHEALPEMNFEDVKVFDESCSLFSSALFVASMTAGHSEGDKINRTIAEACSIMSWPFAVGSQRRELYDKEDGKIWKELRNKYANLSLLGNIGLSQLIQAKPADIQSMIENMNPKALMVHTNPLQEVIQKEGTPYFRGGIEALENVCKTVKVPVILKETGCGFSKETLAKLNQIGLHAVDLSGLGGTHWGRIEGKRSDLLKSNVATTFKDWGNSTLDSLLAAQTQKLNYQIWASGGIRSGLDVAKCIALGAKKVSLAKPIMERALVSTEAVVEYLKQTEYELRVAMFCTGSEKIEDLRNTKHIKNFQRFIEPKNV
ncbi:MAG: type 2 isopentenyl-diphosphate Delta-isomerase [Bdellovibrionales bacterium]|nr:type 2 isopentenyl-diphosphate Delta-isomerase [Bdellovibrionales bacterium]